MIIHFPRLSTSLRIVALIMLVNLGINWSPGFPETVQRPGIHQGLTGLPPEAQYAISRLLGHRETDYHLTAIENGFHMTRSDQVFDVNFTFADVENLMDELLLSDPWIEQGKLIASDGAERDVFGSAVAISEDIIVVGAAGDNGEQGSAYVFVKPAMGWANMTEVAKLTASDGVALDWFGYSVAIDGDTIVVGAPGGPTGQVPYQARPTSLSSRLEVEWK